MKRKSTGADGSASTRESTFDAVVAAVVRSIPRGETLSYARVAMFAGKPGAARAVVRALHRIPGIPWWRVIRSDGTVAPEIAVQQSRRLRAEGTGVIGRRVVCVGEKTPVAKSLRLGIGRRRR